MLDIKFIRENKDLVASGAVKKHIDFNVEELLGVDDTRRAILLEVETMRMKQNEITTEISNPKRREPFAVQSYTTDDVKTRDQLIAESKEIKEVLKKKEDELTGIMKKWQALMVQVPNIPDMSVPEGASDKDNSEVKVWGEIPKFDFEPKNHIELMQNLKMLDLERGTKVAGFRGYFLMGDGVRLQFALWNFVQDFFLKKGGFTSMMVPALVRREPFMGTGYLPQSEEDLYKTQDGDYLSGTAEVSTMGYYMDEVLDKKDFPIKMLAFSPAFRREAGSHGKDTKGIMRVHEFYKFEQVVLCEASHEESVKLHEELTANAEEIMQALGLPYHVVVNCGGDLGLGQVKKYDIEAWMPGEGAYRETHSASYFHDFQTRRLNIRYKDTDGKLRFAHSLNNTALSGRPMIALVETYQNADGTITVPEVLRPYMGKDKIG